MSYLDNDIFNIYSTNFFYEIIKVFESKRQLILENRLKRKLEKDKKIIPNYLYTTLEIRKNKWKLNDLDLKLKKRQVEIISPPYKNMIDSFINSDIDSYICDFNNSLTPTFKNIKQGHINIYNLIKNNNELPLIFFRPRDLYLEESNIFSINNNIISASLFDFSYYFFNNINELINKKIGPYFDIPEINDLVEARFWKELFIYSEDYFSLEKGTIKITININNLNSFYNLEEILFELRSYCVGVRLNDCEIITDFLGYNSFYINSNLIDLKYDFLRKYKNHILSICHKRNTLCLTNFDTFLNENLRYEFLNKYIDEGFDGFYIKNPMIIDNIKTLFNEKNILFNQIKKINNIKFNYKECILNNNISQSNLEFNIKVLTKYIESWIDGIGIIVINEIIINIKLIELIRINLINLKNINKKYDIKFIINCINKYTNNRSITNLIYNLITNEDIICISDFLSNEIGSNII
jgi:malate synthase